MFVFFFQMPARDFPGGRGLSLHASNAGGLDLIPGQGTRSYMLQLKPNAVKLKHIYTCGCVRVRVCVTHTRLAQGSGDGGAGAAESALPAPAGEGAAGPDGGAPSPLRFLPTWSDREREEARRPRRQADTWSRRWRLFCRAAQAHRNQQSPSSPCFTCPSGGLPANSRGVAQIS